METGASGVRVARTARAMCVINCYSKSRLLPAAAHCACGCETKHRIQGPGDVCGLSSPLWQGPAAGIILCQRKIGCWHRQAIGGVGHQDCPFEGAGADSSYRACSAGTCVALNVGRLQLQRRMHSAAALLAMLQLTPATGGMLSGIASWVRMHAPHWAQLGPGPP